MKFRNLPIFLVFFVMGVADAMGPMADAVRQHYHLSSVMAALLPFAVFIAFALFSVPGGLLAARIGKKKLLILGLAINSLAILVPVLQVPSFSLLIGCIFLMGLGTTLLQVAGNPIMRDLSAPGSYARSLSLAQFVKGVGSLASAYLVGIVGLVAMLQAMGWRSAFPVFLGLMLLALVSALGLQVEEAQVESPPGVGDSLALLQTPAFALAVFGIFLYVGAEVCLATYLKPALRAAGLTDGRAAFFGAPFFFGGLTLGRLIGSGVLAFLTPRAFFRLSSCLGLAGIACLATGHPGLALAGTAICGLGFANIWPLLFSITVEARPERASELSGLMCMAISGGAILPLLMGKMVDAQLMSFSFLVPLLAFGYLFLLSLGDGTRAIGS